MRERGEVGFDDLFDRGGWAVDCELPMRAASEGRRGAGGLVADD